MIVVKKYSNRRLYDTDWSRYVTLDEVAERIREGNDVRVVDAKSGEDLTQPVLAQIILESRGAGRMLPATLLAQLIRMDDEDLSEFLGRTMSWSLEMYLQFKRGAGMMGPLGMAPFQVTSAMARMLNGFSPWGIPGMRPPAMTPTPGTYASAPEPPAAPPVEAHRALPESDSDDLASLRRELEALKAAVAAQGTSDS